MHEEHLFGGGSEHSQPQASGQEQFLQFTVPLLQCCATSAVSFPLSCITHPALPFTRPYLEAGTHTTAHKSFLPTEAFSCLASTPHLGLKTTKLQGLLARLWASLQAVLP